MPAPDRSNHQDLPVICIRGTSRSGKTSVAERLIATLHEKGHRAAYIKRTHHGLDLPDKSSSRIWSRSPGAMTIHAADRIQLTLPPGPADVPALLRTVPAEIDLVFVETHSPEPYPTFLSSTLEPEADEAVIGRWDLSTIDEDAARFATVVESMLPADQEVAHGLRIATALHGGHACAGLVLGTRLAFEGARALGLLIPDRDKRLVVSVEIDRCAADAIQAVTGCRPGRRTMRVLDYGKLAATFIDLWSGAAVRVAARGDLRERAALLALPGEERHDAQRRIYRDLPPEDLFSIQPANEELDQYDLPGPPRRRVHCITCGEEVSDGRDVETEEGSRCRPCAAVATATTRSESR